jgi:hypothetical protein
MALVSKKRNKKENQPKKVDSPNISLTEDESQMLLSLIKNSNFKGKDLELLYKLTMKIQNVYIHYNPNLKT